MQQALNEPTEKTLFWGVHSSPFGDCLVGLCSGQVAWLSFPTDGGLTESGLHWPYGRTVQAPDKTEEYIGQIFRSGARSKLRISLYLKGSPFQLEVWEALKAIPEGETRTYGEIAEAIGRPRASRAVGTAIGANPVSYLVPCHRVIRSDGGLGGYRWGTKIKHMLLRAEGVELRGVPG